ncbi:MAG: hypothetical protein R2856_11375 [Caldilineaceae bacterium]
MLQRCPQSTRIDISYVPTHDTTHSSITVLVDDVLVDLYPIRWSWLTQMADFATVNATILLRAGIVPEGLNRTSTCWLAV